MERQSLGRMLLELWRHLPSPRRRHFAALLILMVCTALAEVVSLGAVLPFIGVLASPERVFDIPAVAALAGRLGIETPQALVVPLTIAFIGAAVVSGAMRIALSWFSSRLSFATGADLSFEIYRRTLRQPYSVHVGRNSSELISGITGKVGRTILGILLPVIQLVSATVLFTALFLTLVAINPGVALLAALGFGLSYGVVIIAARRRLVANSKVIAEENTRVVQALQEGLGSVRDVLLDGTQDVYCELYGKADRPWRLAQGENIFIAQSPRFALEALGMIMISALALVLSSQSGGLSAALPVLGALALGAQRILPVLQLAYRSWSTIAGSHASFVDTLELLDQPVADMSQVPEAERTAFDRSIDLRGVGFRYAEDQPWVLRDIDLTLQKGSRIGFVGSTGCGKSTLMDIILGLLEPDEGQLLVDGAPLTGTRREGWRRQVAHVPQAIFLSDASLRENIALGVRIEDIDDERVHEVCRLARLDAFLASAEDGLNTRVGERGVKLSGGQRQRIGIARALYKRSALLVLDEATSALDNATELEVIRSIEQLDDDLTILMIAHRLSTVRHCDQIVEIKGGRISAVGTFDELIAGSGSFRELVDATKTAP